MSIHLNRQITPFVFRHFALNTVTVAECFQTLCPQKRHIFRAKRKAAEPAVPIVVRSSTPAATSGATAHAGGVWICFHLQESVVLSSPNPRQENIYQTRDSSRCTATSICFICFLCFPRCGSQLILNHSQMTKLPFAEMNMFFPPIGHVQTSLRTCSINSGGVPLQKVTNLHKNCHVLKNMFFPLLVLKGIDHYWTYFLIFSRGLLSKCKSADVLFWKGRTCGGAEVSICFRILGPPSRCPFGFLFFGWEGSPTIDYRQKLVPTDSNLCTGGPRISCRESITTGAIVFFSRGT